MGLNRNQIKYIALIAMFIDHIAMFFINPNTITSIVLYTSMRTVGRLTAPIMCFFLAEGFKYTRSKFKYGIRLAIFALLSQIPYSLAETGKVFTPYFNMITTLFISFLMLLAYEKIHNKVAKWIVIVLLISSTIFSDWSIFGPLMVLLFYIIKDKRKRIIGYTTIAGINLLTVVIFCLINNFPWYGELWQAGMFLAIPIFLLYNGESGSQKQIHKWIFYILYPAHLLIIYFLKVLL